MSAVWRIQPRRNNLNLSEAHSPGLWHTFLGYRPFCIHSPTPILLIHSYATGLILFTPLPHPLYILIPHPSDTISPTPRPFHTTAPTFLWTKYGSQILYQISTLQYIEYWQWTVLPTRSKRPAKQYSYLFIIFKLYSPPIPLPLFIHNAFRSS